MQDDNLLIRNQVVRARYTTLSLPLRHPSATEIERKRTVGRESNLITSKIISLVMGVKITLLTLDHHGARNFHFPRQLCSTMDFSATNTR